MDIDRILSQSTKDYDRAVKRSQRFVFARGLFWGFVVAFAVSFLVRTFL